MFRREPAGSEPPDLAAMMVAYQNGDLSAVDGLYVRLAPGLRRCLTALARDPSWADDLVQETFLQIHRSRQTYRPACPVKPWAFAIARHVFLMSRRARRRKGDFDRAPDGAVDLATTRAHDEAILARDHLAHGLAMLSPGTRRAVWLHHVLGWNFDAVGARLGIRGPAAKLRASRGMFVLRRSLGGKQRGDGH